MASLPELIPLKILFGNPEKTSPNVSPDGKSLAYLAPSEDKDVLNVFVRSVDSDNARMVTKDELRGISVVPPTTSPFIHGLQAVQLD